MEWQSNEMTNFEVSQTENMEWLSIGDQEEI